MATRIKLSGDTQLADQYRFIAYRKHLADALKLRSFQGLPIYRHQARLPGGGMVDIICHHGDNEITIYMPPRPQPQPQEVPRPEAVACVISIGEDGVGHWFFLWNPVSGKKMSDIFKANTLNDIYTRFYPIQQDAIFIPKNSYGGHPDIVFSEDGFFGAAELSCSPPDENDDNPSDLSVECTDQKTNTYTHPTAGEVTDYYTLHKYYIVPENDPNEDWWLIFEWGFDMPFVGHPNRSLYQCILLDPIPVEAQLTQFPFQADTFPVTIPHDYKEIEVQTADSGPGGEMYGWRDYSYDTPPGKMRRLKGESYANIPDMNDEEQIEDTKLRHGLLPKFQDDATMFDQTSVREAQSTTGVAPFRQKKTWANWWDVDTDAKISGDLQSKQCRFGFCQAFLTSWVEWKGYTDTPGDQDSWSQVDSQDMIYVSAASGLKKPDSGFERSEALEQAIKTLIEQATEDQRSEGIIDQERMFKGQLNMTFTDLARQEDEQLERAKMMEFVRLTNEAREERGKATLRWNFDLEHAARRQAVDCAVNKPVSGPDPHTGSDGSSGMGRIYNSGFWDCQYFTGTVELSPAIGENILWLTLGEEPNTAQRAFDRWKASLGHWENMMYDDYRETALDIRYMTGSDGYRYAVWVNTFGYNWYNEQ